LIELVVVILIITLLLTLGAAGLRNMGVGKGTSSAVSVAEALFDEARSTAIGKGTEARVLIDINDPQDDENYLRRMLVVYKDVDQNGKETDNWIVSSRPTLLPEKVFYSQSLSKKDQKNGSGTIDDWQLTSDRTALNGRYLFYSFNAQGICSTPGASFIVGTGARPSGEAPRATGEGKRDFAGFVIWRNGHTSAFRDPEQMDLPQEISTF